MYYYVLVLSKFENMLGYNVWADLWDDDLEYLFAKLIKEIIYIIWTNVEYRAFFNS